MDKINLAYWDQYFDTTEQQLLYNSERYTHMSVGFQQTGLATGKLSAINTPDMLFTDLYLETEKPLSLFDTEPKESAESVFVLQGDVESKFVDLHESLCFGKQQHNIQYNTNFSGTHIIHSKKFHACTITYHPAFLRSLMENESTGLLRVFNSHLHQKKNFLGSWEAFHWQKRVADIIMSIRQCPFHDVTRYIFTESKLLELFVLQMEQVNALHSGPEPSTWSASDREKLFAVKEFISLSYLEPLSLKILCTRFGLNEYKLKKGYRHFFQTTVFGNIHQLRMEQARHLLAEKMMNVTEVAYHIGYRDLSSFSYAFKKNFGFNPTGPGR